MVGAKKQKDILQYIERTARERIDLEKIPGLLESIAGSIPQIVEELQEEAKSLEEQLIQAAGE